MSGAGALIVMAGFSFTWAVLNGFVAGIVIGLLWVYNAGLCPVYLFQGGAL